MQRKAVAERDDAGMRKPRFLVDENLDGAIAKQVKRQTAGITIHLSASTHHASITPMLHI